MIDNSKEYISCSAIHYDNGKHYPWQEVYGIKSGFVLCGFRHPVIMGVLPENPYMCDEEPERNPTVCEWNSAVGVSDCSIKTTQGFMTSLSRFVNRKEAAKIAYNCGQIEDKEKLSLFSEDIFPNQSYKATI